MAGPLQARARDAALDAVDPASLSRMSMAELDEVFATLEPAALDELQGHRRGRVVAVAGLSWLPGSVRRALFDRGPWRGESLDGEFGANTWLPGGRVELGHYLVREAPALDGSGLVLRLDHDVAANAMPLRGLVGELRHLGPGLALVRMHYVWGQRRAKLLYFTLET